MTDLGRVRAALQSADGVGGVLDASWDAFDLLVTECQRDHDQPPGYLAWYAFAAVAAAQGRTVVSGAPSLPVTRRMPLPARTPGLPSASPEMAGTLAGLAGLLDERLTDAAGLAGDDRDQAACAHAALQAAVVCKLLSGDP
ncbi:MAG TPA: hypothetical protein VFQ44_09530 [Streptosporangiaceae bacterium]|nr:hypothetical protein [Streptosporangiaceae bacterium]